MAERKIESRRSTCGRIIRQNFCTTAGKSIPSALAGIRPRTPFQLRVWRALLRVPTGSLTTYGRLSAAIGQPGLPAPSAVRSVPIRSPSSSRATASFVRLERWEITAAVGFGNAPSSDGNFHHKTRSAGKKRSNSGPRRLNNQPKIDIVAAPKYRKRSLLAYGQNFSRLRRFRPRIHRRRIAAGRSRSRPDQTVSELVPQRSKPGFTMPTR